MFRSVLLSFVLIAGLCSLLVGAQAKAVSGVASYTVMASSQGQVISLICNSYSDAAITAQHLKSMGIINVQIQANQGQVWFYRVHLSEWDWANRRWRFVGVCENLSLANVLHYAQSFKAVNPNYRAWTGPEVVYFQ